MAKNAKRPVETLAPTVNFTVTTADRMRAAAGPSAYMTRRRTLEDLGDELLEMTIALLDAGARSGDGPGDGRVVDDGVQKLAFTRRLARLNTLIDTHNKYYPSEANLPLDPRTGHMIERGAPWRPLENVTIEALLRRAREAIALRNP